MKWVFKLKFICRHRKPESAPQSRICLLYVTMLTSSWSSETLTLFLFHSIPIGGGRMWVTKRLRNSIWNSIIIHTEDRNWCCSFNGKSSVNNIPMTDSIGKNGERKKKPTATNIQNKKVTSAHASKSISLEKFALSNEFIRNIKAEIISSNSSQQT